MIPLITFIGTILLFLVIAIGASSRINTYHDFRNDPSYWSNIISLTVANITLGTGVIYILQSSVELGLWFLLIPIGIFLGYLSLAYLYHRIPDEAEDFNDTPELIDTLYASSRGSFSFYFSQKFALRFLNYIFSLLFSGALPQREMGI